MLLGFIRSARTGAEGYYADEFLFVSQTCCKPDVLVAQLRYTHDVNEHNSRMIFAVSILCKEKNLTLKNYFSIFN